MKKPSIDLGPFFEAIQKLTKVQKILICVGAFIFLIAPFAYFSYMPSWEEIEKLEKEVVELDKRFAEVEKKAKNLNNLKAELKEKEVKFKEAKAALPDSEEIPSLLANVSKLGQEAGLEFIYFTPTAEKIIDFYAEVPINIQVIGGYHSVILFFSEIAKLSRIVNVRDIKIAPRDKNSSDKVEKLIVTCTVVTYKFVEAPPQKKK